MLRMPLRRDCPQMCLLASILPLPLCPSLLLDVCVWVHVCGCMCVGACVCVYVYVCVSVCVCVSIHHVKLTFYIILHLQELINLRNHAEILNIVAKSLKTALFSPPFKGVGISRTVGTEDE